MERKWKLAKAVAFILSLIAFVYVGQIISQNGRYQPNPNSGGAFSVIDTQTGRIYIYDPQADTFYKYDSENQTFKKQLKNN
jgi:hypothetical protein